MPRRPITSPSRLSPLPRPSTPTLRTREAKGKRSSATLSRRPCASVSLSAHLPMTEPASHVQHHHRSLSGSSSLTARASYLDSSALSPAEHTPYFKWVSTIKPSRSGEADHIDEQDALRFLREECGIEVQDEIKVSGVSDIQPNQGSSHKPARYRFFPSLSASPSACCPVISLPSYGWLPGCSAGKSPPRGFSLHRPFHPRLD